MISPFGAIKERVDIRDVCARYGITLDSQGKGLCPLHEDKTPSFSVKGQWWRCFGCNESGSAIDLVAHLQNVTLKEAAMSLDTMYGLGLFNNRPSTKQERQAARDASEKRKKDRAKLKAFEVWTRHVACVLADFLQFMDNCLDSRAPKNIDEEWHESFVYAAEHIDWWNHVYMSVFVNGNFEDQLWFYENYKGWVNTIDTYIRFRKTQAN
jgi:hypothetical protein